MLILLIVCDGSFDIWRGLSSILFIYMYLIHGMTGNC